MVIENSHAGIEPDAFARDGMLHPASLSGRLWQKQFIQMDPKEQVKSCKRFER
jgi:hypothetical protein